MKVEGIRRLVALGVCVVVFLLIVVLASPGPTRAGVVIAAYCNTDFLASEFVVVRYGAAAETYQVQQARTCIAFYQHIGQNVTVQEFRYGAQAIAHYTFSDGVSA